MVIHKVLVVDDDKILQQSVRHALVSHQFDVTVADNGLEALNKVKKQKFDLVVMDVNMPELDGISALAEMKKEDPSIIVIILTAYSNVNDAVRAVKEGAYNYLEKPISSESLVALIRRALKARSFIETMAYSAPKVNLEESTPNTTTSTNTNTVAASGQQDQFVGKSQEMMKVFSIIAKLAKVSTPVLIRGESGTGKELVARAIHLNGPRKDEKFVTINCGAIPENLIESELFGHEKGAFTGADGRKIGKFQFAEGGTLFLDEVGDLSPATQVKLLRVLQEKSFTPVGSNREIKVDVRIIAASHRPFEEMIKEKTFREDLFYRLNVLPVYLPPLRERSSDIPHLIDYYVNYFNKVHDLQVKGATPEAMALLTKYSWPGNIRELRNVIEHCFIMESSDYIAVNSLPEVITKSPTHSIPRSPAEIDHELENSDDFSDLDEVIDLDDIQSAVITESNEQPTLPMPFELVFLKDEALKGMKIDYHTAKDHFEKEFIIFSLKQNRGRINQTALNANIPKKTLLRKIEKYQINAKDYYPPKR